MASAASPVVGWRPPQWNKPATVVVTVPAGYAPLQPAGAADPDTDTFTLKSTVTASVSYVFDAVLSLDHEQALTKTRHPVQTGTALTSHAYIEPAQLILYVLMSDVAGQYVAATQTQAPYIAQFTGNPSKSVAAYQQMLTLQKSRTPLTVSTRLRTYNNMLITRVSPHEDDKTITGARFRIEFEQIFIASTQITPTSTRPNDTDSTGLGSINVAPVPVVVSNQFGVHPYAPGPDGPSAAVPLPPDLGNGTIPVVENGIPGYLGGPGSATFTPQYPNTVEAVDVPGAGDYSSSNYNTLQK